MSSSFTSDGQRPAPRNNAEEAIISRRSIRAFHKTPVEEELVRHILQVAARAASGTNMQPWNVHVLMGQKLELFTQAVQAAHNDPSYIRDDVYQYYPTPLMEPYISRRRQVGWDLYSKLGIEKGDKARMHEQHGRNYLFFDAPVGMIFTLDERLEIGSWLDYGMFMQNIMVAARGHGLDTCPQAAFAPFHGLIREQLGIDEGQIVICGMALGHANWDAVENSVDTPRALLEEWAHFHTD